MATVKKTSKLSRKRSQNTLSSQGSTQSQLLNDSTDDFQPIFVTERRKNVTNCISTSQPTLSSTSVATKSSKDPETSCSSIHFRTKHVNDDNLSKNSTPTANSSTNTTANVSSEETELNLPCPMCGRRFKTKSLRQSHLKSCANTHGLSIEGVKSALELQEKQAEERKSLGFPAFPQAPPKTKGKRTSKTMVVDENELQMALALSVSLEHAKNEALQKEEALMVEEGLEEQVIQKREEEEEKEKARSAFLASFVQPQPVRRKKKNLRPEDFTLLKRSSEDRQRVLSERITEVLSEELPQLQLETHPLLQKKQLKSDYLKTRCVEEKILWNLSQKSCPEKEEFYVPALRPFVSPTKSSKENANLFHWSQIPGRLPSPGKSPPARKSVTRLEFSLSCGATQAALEDLAKENTAETTIHSPKALDSDRQTNKIVYGNGFQCQDESKTDTKAASKSDAKHLETLAFDWKEYVNNPTYSDIVIKTQDSQVLYAHQLVLQVRAPLVLQDLHTNTGEKVLYWTHSPHSAALALLLYVYAGFTQVSSLNQPEKAALKYYSQKYALIGLIDELEGVEPVEPVNSFCENEKNSQNCSSPDLFCDSDPEDSPNSKSISERKKINSEGNSKENLNQNLKLSQEKQSSPESLQVIEDILETDDKNIVDLTQSTPETISEPRTPSSSRAKNNSPGLNQGRLSLSPIEVLRDDCHNVTSNMCPERTPNFSRNLSNVWEGFDEQGYYDELQLSEAAPPDLEAGNRNGATQAVAEFKTPTSKAPVPRIAQQSSTPDIGFDVNDSVLWRSENEPALPDSPVSSIRREKSGLNGQSRTSNVAYRTPEPEPNKKRKRTETAVTPLPNYQEMPTPELKRELDKFGLKPLRRKNAVKMLNHIYDSTHPWVTDSESENSFAETANPTGTLPTIPDADSDEEDLMSCSETSEIQEECLALDFEDFEDSEVPSTSSGDRDTRFYALIKGKPDLWNRVLQYEPIPFETLLADMRKAGIRAKPNQLMDWLDEQCITFRMTNNRRGRKSNSPIKKTAAEKAKKAKR